MKPSLKEYNHLLVGYCERNSELHKDDNRNMRCIPEIPRIKQMLIIKSDEL